MFHPSLLVVAHVNLGTSLSGGDRIFLNLIKHWQKKFNITTIGSTETRKLLFTHHIKTNFISSSNLSHQKLDTISLLIHHFSRFISGIKFCLQHQEIFRHNNYIYTSSDFYGDFIFGIIAKIINPKICWLCGYYLIAPSPFSQNSPYIKNHFFFRGLVYFIAQIPTIITARLVADYIFITSEPDSQVFGQKSIIVQGGVTIPAKKSLPDPNTYQHRCYDAFYLGRLHAQKGVLELIDIWRLVVNKIPKAKLVIVGDGELLLQIKSKISQLKLNKNILLTGFLTGSKKFNLIKESKIVVHPATYDSGGMAAAEAMAWGLPAVSYDLPALKTYYPQGMIKTPCFKQPQFAKNIIALLTNPTLYLSTSKSARSLIEQQWSWQKRFKRIFRQINTFHLISKTRQVSP